ncbi:hypothetical protein Hanom_Chr05g00473391 [Helianthus anomalus]
MWMIGGWGVGMTVVIVEDEGGWWVFRERGEEDGSGGCGGEWRWQWWLRVVAGGGSGGCGGEWRWQGVI